MVQARQIQKLQVHATRSGFGEAAQPVENVAWAPGQPTGTHSIRVTAYR
jgi:hypothetical protein